MANYELSSFVKLACQYQVILNINNDERKAQTSCIHNVMALSVIFSGIQKQKSILDHLICTTSSTHRISVDYTPYLYILNNLFTGLYLARCDQEGGEDKVDLAEVIAPLSNDFNSYFLSKYRERLEQNVGESKKLERSLLEEYFECPNYDFNVSILNVLEEKIKLNQDLVTQDKSWVYYIGMVNPGNTYTFYHAFIIEQYYSPLEKETRYRLYQSWHGRQTLLQHFTRMSYGKNDKGCLSKEELLDFFHDIREILNPLRTKYHFKFLNKGTCMWFNSSPSLTFYDKQSHALFALSLRFFALEVCPKDCLKNYTSLLSDSMQV